MKDLTVTRPFSEEDYNELLQQAVAVIETSEYYCDVFLLGDWQVVRREKS